MNWALLAKIAWWVLTKKGEVWRDVSRAKYEVLEDYGAHFKGRRRESHIWRGIVCGGTELLR